MDQYRDKNSFGDNLSRGCFPGIAQQAYQQPLQGQDQCERPETAVESLTSRNRSNNSSLLELEMRLHTMLNRIGHPIDVEKGAAPPPPPSKGSFHELGESVQNGASIGARLHQLMGALETYV